MKDIHSHILYGIDDGCKTFDESVSILNKLYKEGITDLVATPHYIIGSNYNYDNKNKNKLIKELSKKSKINIYIGNEVFIDNDIYKYIKSNKISTINNSRYLLVELPLENCCNNTQDILLKLIDEGIVPVIAHVERYEYLSIESLKEFINIGCLLQANITSLNLKYGRSPKKRLKQLLKNNMIFILGTDTHISVLNLDLCLKKLSKLVNSDYYNNLINNNFDKLINNEDINIGGVYEEV